jgi:AhpD family alkylhydroperoxidase
VSVVRIHPPAGKQTFLEHRPELFAAFNRFYGTLWSDGVLDQPTKEVARLRNARVTGCGICRNLRFAGARDAGLDEDLVEQIRDDHAASALPSRFKLALRLVDVLIGATPHEVDGALAAELRAAFAPAEIVELALTTAIAQGFSKAAVAWGPAPDIPLTVIPTPQPAANAGVAPPLR